MPRMLRCLLLATLLLLTGCAASDPMRPARTAYSLGDYQLARGLVEELVADDDDNIHVFQLEHGMTALATVDADAAVSSWRDARDRLDELGGRGILETAGTWLSDDTALDYEGAAYERVMVRAMLASAELVATDRAFGDDAIAYALQVGEEQRRILDELRAAQDDLEGRSVVDPAAAFKFVAFGSYLAAVIREADPVTIDAARFQMQRVVELEPQSDWLRAELQRLEAGRFSDPGKGVVHLLGMVGRAPFKEEVEVVGSQAAFQLAQIIIGAMGRSFPQISVKGVPIDRLVFQPDNPRSLRVEVDGNAAGETRTVTDIEQVAEMEYAATLDYRVARALARRAIKVAVTEGARIGAREATRNSDPLIGAAAELTAIGLGSFWQASEVADLRCWSLLPARCQAIRLELDPGEHTITVQPRGPQGVVGPPTTIRVNVSANRPTYVMAVAPTITGPVPMLSRQAVQAPTDPSPESALP